LAFLNNRLKEKNNWLENRVKSLEEELENSKTDFENLEIIYTNFSCKCDALICENCENLEKKVHYLVKTVDKLSKGQSNFENVLASKTVFLEKLDWVLTHKTNKIDFQNHFRKCQKNNQLDHRNNRLLHASIA